MSEQPASLPPLATLDEDELYDLVDEVGEEATTCHHQPMSLDHLLAMQSVQDKLDTSKVPRRVELIPYRRPSMSNSEPKPIAAVDDRVQLSSRLVDKIRKCKQDEEEDDDNEIDEDERLIMEELQEENIEQQQQQPKPNTTTPAKDSDKPVTLSDSLEQLVSSFDEQVRSCLRDLHTDITGLAPVQKRPQEEFIKDRM